MSINKVFFSTAAALMMLGACSNEYFIQTEGNMPTKDDIMQVKRGMPQSEVRKIMGSPSVISSLDHRTWIYMNSTMERMAFFEPEELDRNVVAIEFNHDGKVEKVVQLTKENGRNIAISKDETPVMGSEETFMEKYFGGVGYMPIQPTKENNGLKIYFSLPRNKYCLSVRGNLLFVDNGVSHSIKLLRELFLF